MGKATPGRRGVSLKPQVREFQAFHEQNVGSCCLQVCRPDKVKDFHSIGAAAEALEEI